MSHQFTSQAEMTSVERNAETLDAARSSASSSKREAGDLPSPIDSNRPRPVVDHKPAIWSAAAYIPTPSFNEGIIKAVEGFEDLHAAELNFARAVNERRTKLRAHEAVGMVATAGDRSGAHPAWPSHAERTT